MTDAAVAKKRTRWELITLGCMFVGYIAFILARTVLAVVSPDMVSDPNLELDEASYGDIAAWGINAVFLLVGIVLMVTSRK